MKEITYLAALCMIVTLSACKSASKSETKDIALSGLPDGKTIVAFAVGDDIVIRECLIDQTIPTDRNCPGHNIGSIPIERFTSELVDRIGVPNYRPDQNGIERINRIMEQIQSDLDSGNLSVTDSQQATVQLAEYRRQLQLSQEANAILNNLKSGNDVTYLPYRSEFRLLRELLGGGYYCTSTAHHGGKGPEISKKITNFGITEAAAIELNGKDIKAFCRWWQREEWLKFYCADGKKAECVHKNIAVRWQSCPSDDDCDGVPNVKDKCPGTPLRSYVKGENSAEGVGCSVGQGGEP